MTKTIEASDFKWEDLSPGQSANITHHEGIYEIAVTMWKEEDGSRYYAYGHGVVSLDQGIRIGGANADA